jgi:hypothetical protein
MIKQEALRNEIARGLRKVMFKRTKDESIKKLVPVNANIIKILDKFIKCCYKLLCVVGLYLTEVDYIDG